MCLRRCYFFPRRQFACAILNLPGKVISPSPALHYFLYRPLQRGFIHPLLGSAAPPFPSPPAPPHRVQITRCCFMPWRPCGKFIGPWAAAIWHATTWLTDLVPFPISSGSCAKLTFPAFGLYLNCERPKTYGAGGNFIITAVHLSDFIQARAKAGPYIYTARRQTRANLTVGTSVRATATASSARLWNCAGIAGWCCCASRLLSGSLIHWFVKSPLCKIFKEVCLTVGFLYTALCL